MALKSEYALHHTLQRSNYVGLVAQSIKSKEHLIYSWTVSYTWSAQLLRCKSSQ